MSVVGTRLRRYVLRGLFPLLLSPEFRQPEFFACSFVYYHPRTELPMPSMLVHDLRLAGNTPSNLAENNYEVDGTVSISHALDWIHNYSVQQGGLDKLYILCHGYEVNWNLGDQTCTPFQQGGFGLALCAEGLSLSNADAVTVLKGDVTEITIFACATADTGPGNTGTAADGMRFCGEIALYTGATVIAATQTQFYSNERSFWQWITGQRGQIDFGCWEGPVYSFSPDDGAPTLIHPGPPT